MRLSNIVVVMLNEMEMERADEMHGDVNPRMSCGATYMQHSLYDIKNVVKFKSTNQITFYK